MFFIALIAILISSNSFCATKCGDTKVHQKASCQRGSKRLKKIKTEAGNLTKIKKDDASSITPASTFKIDMSKLSENDKK
ncbi:hypothetical protein J7889_04130 [Mycoplasmopsis agalactiae]|nr:hypothetical protein [Mycoplasmopsis agalactiae]